MLVSRAPQAETNLLAALAAAPALAGVTVIGYPVTDGTAAADVVYIDSANVEQTWRGPHARNEDFTLNLVVLCRRADDPAVSKARAWALAGAIQAVVVADWSLGGVCNDAAEVSGIDVQTYPAGIDGAWEARADVRVHGAVVLTE
jgi:hypothetical protein